MNASVGKCYNQGFKYFTRVIWCGVSGLLCWRTYEHYKNGLEYVYLHEILGTWLCLARGSASVLNLNCAVVLLPMCHTIVWLFNRAVRKVNLKIRWVKMETKSFHIFLGYVIFITTGVHVIAHVVNINSFCGKFHEEFPDVNPFPYRPKIYDIIFGTVTGVTGILMTLLLLLIFLTSLKIVRRRYFNTFWYSHRIFVIFYFLFVFHGFRGPLRMQVNVEKHIPGCHRNNETETTVEITGNVTSNITSSNQTFNETCSEGPRFSPIGCHTWIWVGVPMFIYLCDILCRIFRRRHSVDISDVQLICEDIVELSIHKPDLKMRPGQYVFVYCCQISTIEWHPFSVVQVPTSSNGHIFKLWIKSSGDWTDQFIEKTKDSRALVCCETPEIRHPTVKLDGPYSSSMENITKYRVAVCIAGGVGVTPFLSHIFYLTDESRKKKTELKYVLIIVAGRQEGLLRHSHLALQDSCDKLRGRIDVDIKLYYTGKPSLNENSEGSLLIHKGRPSLDTVFTDVNSKANIAHKRSSVGVFACGPAAMCSDVEKQCNIQSSFNRKYVFHKESF